MNIAVRIKELREEQGLSMRKLAERSGLSQAFISSIEAGQKQPTLDSLLKLSSGLGISLIDLLGGDPVTASLPPHLNDLLNNARQLTPAQIDALNQFIRIITEKKSE
jgi:transcriptional regulator with XRE-family HTH domain